MPRQSISQCSKIQKEKRSTKRVTYQSPGYPPVPDLNQAQEENELTITSPEIIVYTRRNRRPEQITQVSDRNIRQRLISEEIYVKETIDSGLAVPQPLPSGNVLPRLEKSAEDGINKAIENLSGKEAGKKIIVYTRRRNRKRGVLKEEAEREVKF